MRFSMSRESYLNKDRPYKLVEFEGGVAYTYEWELPKAAESDIPVKRYGLLVFFGKQNKPVVHEYYRKEESRNESLDRAIKGRKSSLDYKAKMAAERKAGLSNEGIEVGDIFVSSGGYEQTNVEALQVVEKIGKSQVRVRQVGFKEVESHGQSPMSDQRMPVKDSFTGRAPLRGSDVRRVQNGSINGTWGSASKWDGKRSYYCSWYH